MANNKNLNFPINSPLGKNSFSSLKNLFDNKDYYYQTAIPVLNYTLDKSINYTDLLNSDALFGLLDKQLNIILPLEENMKQIASGNEDPKYVMDFVADAFNDMNGYLFTAGLTGKMSRNSVFYNLKAYRAHIKPKFLIDPAQLSLSATFNSYVESKSEISSQIKDPISFNKKFLDYLKQQIKNDLTTTIGSIITTTNFSNFVSGLTIDIAEDKADDDKNKFDKYFLDNDFGCFTDACKRFGFKIDVNIPWRISADLNSPAMLEKTGNHIGYMYRYGINNDVDLYNKRFSPVFLIEIEYLKDFFYKSYSALTNKFPYYQIDNNKLDSCNIKNIVAKERKVTTRQEYYRLFPDTYWVRAYTYLKNYEEKSNLTQQEFDNIVREANNYIKIGKYFPALNYINDHFKKFDNIYYYSNLQLKKDVVQTTVGSLPAPDIIF
jgi:hypothetical protein